MKQAFENRLNVLLSEILQGRGTISKAEQFNHGRTDIIVYHQGIPLLLEGSYSKTDSEKDARKRIIQLDAPLAIAVNYPKIFPQNLSEIEIKKKLEKTKFNIKIIVQDNLPTSVPAPYLDWKEGDIDYLITLLNEIYQLILSEFDIENIENQISALINDFILVLSSLPQSLTIAKKFNSILYKLYGFSIGEPGQIKEAIFAQASLAVFLSAVYYESIKDTHGLGSLSNLSLQFGPQGALERASSEILKIDYEPIFLLTKDLMNIWPIMDSNFKKLIELAIKIAGNRALLRRDIAGRIYHKIIGEWSLKKGLATYYTEIPAAYLLAYLAKTKLSRIADFACGSGTLLFAAYSAANQYYRFDLFAKGIEMDPNKIEADFHKGFMKNCYAFDVLEYATQITALNLAFHSPATPLSDTNIYSLPFGYRKEDDIVSLGSLELIRRQLKLEQIFTNVVQAGISKKRIIKLEKFNELDNFDFIFMNPPFTRATGRGKKEGGGLFGFIASERMRKIVLSDYDNLRNDIFNNIVHQITKKLKAKLIMDKSYLNIGHAGEGLLFLYLASEKVKRGGKICFVLPKSILTGISWFLARALLLTMFHIEYIIVSYDNKRGNNFSQSTNLSECLIVARKVDAHSKSEETRFVLVLDKPSTSIESIAFAREIENGKDYVSSGNAKAFIITANYSQLEEELNNWGSFVAFPELNILKYTKKLLKGNITIGEKTINIPLNKFDNLISSIGIDRHQVHSSFKFSSEFIPGSIRLLIGGGESQRKKMSINANHFGLPLSDISKSLFDKYAGILLVPDRIRVNTTHAIAMISTEPVLSNIFYAINLKDNNDIRKHKAICLWLNTTWGILILLSKRGETQGPWIQIKLSQWRSLPILDINKLEDSVLNDLSKLYDKYSQKELGRLPYQYDDSKDLINIRLEIDTGLIRAMGFDVNSEDLLALYKSINDIFRQWTG